MKQDKGIENEYRAIAEILKGVKKNKAITDAISGHRILMKEIIGQFDKTCEERGL